MNINIILADGTIVGSLPASQEALDFIGSIRWIDGVKLHVEIVRPEPGVLANPFGDFVPKRGDTLRLTGTGKMSVTAGQVSALMELTTLSRSEAREVLTDVCDDNERTITLRPTVSINHAKSALQVQDVYSSIN